MHYYISNFSLIKRRTFINEPWLLKKIVTRSMGWMIIWSHLLISNKSKVNHLNVEFILFHKASKYFLYLSIIFLISDPLAFFVITGFIFNFISHSEYDETLIKLSATYSILLPLIFNTALVAYFLHWFLQMVNELIKYLG